jgi:hypothetical protein
LEENTDTMFSPEDGGSMFLLNVGIYLQVYTALQPAEQYFKFINYAPKYNEF